MVEFLLGMLIVCLELLRNVEGEKKKVKRMRNHNNITIWGKKGPIPCHWRVAEPFNVVQLVAEHERNTGLHI